MSGIRARLDYILKHSIVINKLFRCILSYFFRFLGIFIKIDDKRIIFSGLSRKYNDSPRKIYEYMVNSKQYQDYTFVWALDNPEEVEIPGVCIKIKTDTLQYFIETLRCKYWVTCVNIERSLRYKKRKTVYLNTWHGTPLKTIGNAALGRKDYDFSYIDLFCAAGEYEANIYIRDFKVKPNSILRVGLPRNDDLYDVTTEEINSIRKKLDIPNGKKVLLYAPTWRDSIDGGKTYTIKPPIDFKYWEEKLSDEYVLLLRTHPYTNSLLGVQFNDFVRDYTAYNNINDLLKISDILISDYSATIFDFSILCRPIICFAYDYTDYCRERGLYLNLQEIMPKGIEESEISVVERIENIDWEKESNLAKRFKERFLEYGGNATEICIKALLKDRC